MGSILYKKQLGRAPCFAMVASCAVFFFEVGKHVSEMTKTPRHRHLLPFAGSH
jgi:hypothetical protein